MIFILSMFLKDFKIDTTFMSMGMVNGYLYLFSTFYLLFIFWMEKIDFGH